ncbi:hypothetical protein DZB84_09885 [Bacillus sp. HNG]|uniref:hypothetical protein n=1 Tax=Bacillus sp. HNG TaxID=2293325 RepID=UPI000E2FD311|nr:hypothetical protein [Bacillus sp. HNG]RFB17368.1 hypothetical protein DZB84_09885 [Bacillus sp. HNG]
MKLKILLCIALLFLFISPASAAEKSPFFGVSATVVQVEDGTFEVKTKGEEENEGFVFSPKGVKGGETIVFEVQVKGNTAVYLLVDETDARGTFLAESVSAVIGLHDPWRTIQLEVELQDTTSQIDAMVLTNQKEKTTFMFRNVKMSVKK